MRSSLWIVSLLSIGCSGGLPANAWTDQDGGSEASGDRTGNSPHVVPEENETEDLDGGADSSPPEVVPEENKTEDLDGGADPSSPGVVPEEYENLDNPDDPAPSSVPSWELDCSRSARCGRTAVSNDDDTPATDDPSDSAADDLEAPPTEEPTCDCPAVVECPAVEENVCPPVPTCPAPLPVQTTVGETRNHCAQSRRAYAAQNRAVGESCDFAGDCQSGVCVPTSVGAARCAPYGVESTSSCMTQMGSTYVAVVLDACNDDGLLETCIPRPTAGVPHCSETDELCGTLDACTRNEHCASGYCHFDPNDEYGSCADYCESDCPAATQCRDIDGTDPVSLCTP